MCQDENKRRIPFAFLEDIKTKFVNSYSDRASSAIAFSLNEEFSRVLQKQMEYFNSPAGDSFASVNLKLEDVKNVMIQNIDNVLERGEKLEILVENKSVRPISSFSLRID
jgi:vesicle-associated membrane protein 7